MKRVKKIVIFFLILCVSVLIGTFCTYFWVVVSVSNQMYSNVDSIPYNKVGLLLGTSKYVSNGNPNPYYDYRIDAAVELYKAGKISNILVSGDNRTQYYNEPLTFKKDLMTRGIPEKAIYLDYAGFRTYDSIIRCSEIFGQSRFTIISQRFHCERALYIAKHMHLDAVAFSAQDVSKRFGIWISVREYLARVKMMLDFLFHKEAKFGGEKVIIT